MLNYRSKNQREVKEKDESGRTQVNIPVDPRSVGSNDDNNSSSSSDTESQMSSLGPWGDDPEIQEKVRYNSSNLFCYTIV